MDTIDRPDPNVPARYTADSSRLPAPIAAMSRDLAVAPSTAPQITPRVLMRGLSRHWWRITLCWLVLSAPMAYLIYALVEPTYDAVSLLRAEPATTSLYSAEVHGNPQMQEVKPYLQTQVTLITSDRVLDAALANPAISRLPMVVQSKDPKADLRREMFVRIVGDNTYLIQVGLGSRDPAEAAQIVNAVVDAYIEQHSSYQQTANRTLKKNLEGEQEKLEKKIEIAREKLTTLVKNGNVKVERQMVISKAGKDDSPTSFDTVPEGTYASAAGKLFDMDLQLLEAQAALETANKQYARAQELSTAEGAQKSQLQADQLEDRIREEFQKDPDLQPLIEQINEAREALERNKDRARQADEPAVLHAARQVKKLQKQWEVLWEKKHEDIKKRLQVGGDDQRPEAWAEKVKVAEAFIETIKKKREDLKVMINGMKVVDTAKNADQLEASLLNQDLQYLKRNHDVLKSKLGQLEFEIGQEAYRITVQDKAAVPRMPSNNKRLKYMAAAPVGVLFLMLGVFLLLEVKAERVGDPESLSTRVQSEVYALPPLPTARSIRKRTEADADDQIEQFIQRLDHLRFAVCGNPAGLDKGRCVLITSAVGGEGKTTLAAQLAARCGNAGMSTLLIDADLRRTGLCSLLDIPEGPGLSDALLNDEPAPTELVVPVQGGTFHLLPAGTPIPDTSRILQNRKLGLLIAQFRQLYDLVIIDSPPVLPVPDALILGRWVDGAVLAVRYDISRFPQVERARRQLDGAGIAVLGTVINGMKNSDSYYGRYSYSRKRSTQADAPAAL
jgi:capsular exopolysaccharide synthesis family protein